jgi:hypothetical protein
VTKGIMRRIVEGGVWSSSGAIMEQSNTMAIK